MNKKLPTVAVEVEERGSLSRDRQERKKGKKYYERRAARRERRERVVRREKVISDYF